MSEKIIHIPQEQMARELAKTDFFSGLSEDRLQALIMQFEPVFIAAGSLLMKENDEGDSLYFVITGRLRTIKNYNQENQTFLGEIGRGELVGEFSLLSDEPRSATVIAIRDTLLFEINQNEFFKICTRKPTTVTEHYQTQPAAVTTTQSSSQKYHGNDCCDACR